MSDCLAPGSSVLVIGLGNILQGDDGFGVRVVQRLQERLAEIDTTARIVDGGTAGLGLLPYLEAESRVLFIDAIDVGEAPGALLRIDRAMDLALRSDGLSPHDVDLRDLLFTASLIGRAPNEVLIMGVQPESTAFTTQLTETVAARIEETVDRVLDQLSAWNAVPNSARGSA